MSRFINKLKKLELETVKKASQPKGVVTYKVHDEDLKDMQELDPNEEARADVMELASRVAIVSAGVEIAYKTGSLVHLAREDVEGAGKRLKAKLGVSGTDESWSDVTNSLESVHKVMLHEQKMYDDYLGGQGGSGGSGGSDDNSDNGSGGDDDE